MMLTRQQHDAISFFAQPDQAGLTNKQIAEEVGISERHIYTWKKDPKFQEELKRVIRKASYEHMPKVWEAVVKGAVEDRNAQMARLYFQAHGEIGNDVIEDKPTPDTIADMNKRIEEYRQRQEQAKTNDKSKDNVVELKKQG